MQLQCKKYQIKQFRYLFDIINFQEFLSQQDGKIEDFWVYYDEVEKQQDHQALQCGIEVLIKKLNGIN